MLYRIVVVNAALLCLFACNLRAEGKSPSDEEVKRAFLLWGELSGIGGINSFYNGHLAVGGMLESWVLQKDKHDELRKPFLDELSAMRKLMQLYVQYLERHSNFMLQYDSQWKGSKGEAIMTHLKRGMTLVIAQNQDLSNYIESGDQQAIQKVYANRGESANVLQQLLQMQ